MPIDLQMMAFAIDQQSGAFFFRYNCLPCLAQSIESSGAFGTSEVPICHKEGYDRSESIAGVWYLG